MEAFDADQRLREDLLREMLAEFNEGRSKTYYSIAATLLDVEELRAALREARARDRRRGRREGQVQGPPRPPGRGGVRPFHPSRSQTLMEILLHAPEDFNNVCVLARTLEVLGIGRCHVFDPHRIVRPAYGKSYTRKLRTVSAGAFFRIEFVAVTAPVGVHPRLPPSDASLPCPTRRRRPSTSSSSVGTTCWCSARKRADCPAEVIEACDVRLTIPQRGVTQSLNLCVASGIILGEWFRQLQRGSDG